MPKLKIKKTMKEKILKALKEANSKNISINDRTLVDYAGYIESMIAGDETKIDEQVRILQPVFDSIQQNINNVSAKAVNDYKLANPAKLGEQKKEDLKPLEQPQNGLTLEQIEKLLDAKINPLQEKLAKDESTKILANRISLAKEKIKKELGFSEEKFAIIERLSIGQINENTSDEDVYSIMKKEADDFVSTLGVDTPPSKGNLEHQTASVDVLAWKAKKEAEMTSAKDAEASIRTKLGI